MTAKADHAPLRQVDDASFAAAVGVPGVVVVQFTAAWCQPCAEAGPEIAGLAAEMAGAKGAPAFVAADIDEAPQAAQASGVLAGVPCLVVFRAGARVAELVGHRKRAEVRKWISDVVKGEG